MLLSTLIPFLAAGIVGALPTLQARDNIPKGCREMTNSDLSKLSEPEMELLLEYFNSQLGGQTVCAKGAQDSSKPWGCSMEKVIQGGFFGGLDSNGNPQGSADGATGKNLNWNPNYVNAVLHIPTGNQKADYGLQVPIVCLDEADAWVVFDTDTSQCTYNNFVAKGSTTDSGSSVQVQINQENSISYTYVTESSIDIIASLSYTFTAGIPDEASESITAGLSVDVGNSKSSSTGQETSQSNQLSITVNPGAGQQCFISLTDTTCPGTANITTPVTFMKSSSYGYGTQYNAIVEFPKNRPNNANYNNQNEYFVGDFGSILYPNSSAQQNMNTLVQLAYKSNGNWTEICSCTDGSALINGVCQGSLPTVTVAAYTTTVTQSTLTAYLSTVVDILSTVTKIPRMTKTINTATSYASTVYNTTQTVTASNAQIWTQLSPQTVTDLETSTKTQVLQVTGAASTKTVQSTKTVFVTSASTIYVATTTLRPTITKHVTTSKTVPATGCTTVTKKHNKRDGSTITVTNSNLVATVTDISDIAVITVPSTTTSINSQTVATVTGSSTSTIIDSSHTTYVKGGVLTTSLVQTVSAYTSTIRTTATVNSVVMKTLLSTITIPAAPKTVTAGVAMSTTKTVHTTVRATSTVTALAKTVTSTITSSVQRYTCTKTKSAS